MLVYLAIWITLISSKNDEKLKEILAFSKMTTNNKGKKDRLNFFKNGK